jgi:transposase
MSNVPRPHPKEFRDDVVAVARRGDAPIKQIARDFGISESCLRNWLQAADVEDGNRPGTTASESAELREARKRVGCWSRRTRSCAARRRTSPRRICQENDLPARA